MSGPTSLAEVRGVIASKQGLSCSGYFTLANRTKHLRERLYVTARDGVKLFLPQGNEHFPVQEIEDYYLGRLKLNYYESVGAAGGEVVFTCEGPAADEGATTISAVLASPGLEELLTSPLLVRWASAVPLKSLYLSTLQSESPPYRPDVLPKRQGAPEPVTEEERRRRPPPPTPAEVAASIEEKKRELLKGWGLLEAYEETQQTAKPLAKLARPPVAASFARRTFNQSFNTAWWNQ